MNTLKVNMSRSVINGHVYDVKSYEEYASNPDADTSIAIRYEDMLLPVRGKMTPCPVQPGLYNAGCVDFIVLPKDDQKKDYIPDKIINISENDTIKDILDKDEMLTKMAEPWITSPDNITKFGISPDDRPEMIILKTALNEKNIDFDKYSSRFGDNFPNDKRQLKNNSATLNIIKRFCDNCDMEAALILKDKNPNIPNPMNKVLYISLTNENSEIEELSSVDDIPGTNDDESEDALDMI